MNSSPAASTAATSNRQRRAAVALVTALERMLAALQETTVDCDPGWLRPLAVLSAEIEYSVLRRETVDAVGFADECREVAELLSGSARADGEFMTRYVRARRGSTAVAKLHARALAACRALSRPPPFEATSSRSPCSAGGDRAAHRRPKVPHRGGSSG